MQYDLFLYIAKFIIALIIQPRYKYLQGMLTKRCIINLEHFVEFSMLMKGGKELNESLIETSRMTFLLFTGMTPPIPTTSFYMYVIVWRHCRIKWYWWLWKQVPESTWSVPQQKGVGSIRFLMVVVVQWNMNPCFLIYVRSKSIVIQSISSLHEW